MSTVHVSERSDVLDLCRRRVHPPRFTSYNTPAAAAVDGHTEHQAPLGDIPVTVATVAESPDDMRVSAEADGDPPTTTMALASNSTADTATGTAEGDTQVEPNVADFTTLSVEIESSMKKATAVETPPATTAQVDGEATGEFVTEHLDCDTDTVTRPKSWTAGSAVDDTMTQPAVDSGKSLVVRCLWYCL